MADENYYAYLHDATDWSGEIYEEMRLKLGNKKVYYFAVKDGDGVLVTTLATASKAQFSIKNNPKDDNATALVFKNLAAGVKVNTPSTGWIEVTVDSDDTKNIVLSREEEEKYVALQIQWTGDTKEIKIIENHQEVNKIILVQDVIREEAI